MTVQTIWDQYKVPLSSGITWLVFFGATFLARYKIPPGAWYLGVARAFLGAIIDNIQPSTFKQVAAQASVAKKESKMKKKAVTQALMCFLVLFATSSCGGGLQKQLNSIMVFEQSALKYTQDVQKAADAAIPLLPADQQATKRAELADLGAKVTDAFTKKDLALQDAIAADSAANLDIGKLSQDVVTAVQAFIVLATAIGADAKTLEKSQNALLEMNAKVTKVQLSK